MNILYLGYWSVNDLLTQSVILPRLKILSLRKEVYSIIFCSVERVTMPDYVCDIPKVKWTGLQSVQKRNVLLTKFSDFWEFPKMLIDQIRKRNIDLIIANSPLSGAIALIVTKGIKIPFIVDCFEPHSEYMRQSGVWHWWDLRYIVLNYFEYRQKKKAWRLLSVSNNYSKKLIEEGVDSSKIITVPNTLDIEKFSFNADDRNSVRHRLRFPAYAVIGIYVGKFGGIYYDEEAFELFHQAFLFFEDRFRLIILTPHNKEEIIYKLEKHFIQPDFVYVDCVAHHLVPQYLSASDFAFATIKPAPCRLYCSPVKNGEYWANGLPVLLEDGIGDDSEIIKAEGGGVVYENDKLTEGFKCIEKQIADRPASNGIIVDIARKHRGRKILVNAFNQVIDDTLKRFLK